MTAPPSQWPDKATHLAMTMLAVALMLYIAARLIAAVWPILLAVAVIFVIGWVAWSWWQYQRSRW
jgi:hypothetical protein